MFPSAVKDNLLKFCKKLRIMYFPLLLCYLELVIHFFAYRSFGANTVWIVLFSIGIGFCASFLTSVFPRRVNGILTYVLTFVFTLVFEVELVYYEIFKGFAPVSSVKLGTQAVTNFTGAMLEGIRSAMGWIITLLVPMVLLCVLGILLRPPFSRWSLKRSVIPLALSAVILAGSIGTMAVFFSGTPSLYRTFTRSSTSTDTSVNCFGLNMSIIQELRFMMFPENKRITADSLSSREYEEGDQVDLDLDELFEKAGDDETLKHITSELSYMPVSTKNVYSGLCEGYNLIAICAEAFSPEFVDPELTPTLYMLMNNGFVFENFYASYPNTTTNGEYSFCTGLFPDFSKEKTDSSFGVSASNYLPYCYGNVFSKNGGVAKAYHNYIAEFYYRTYTHTNMGYDFTAANTGLDIEISWPSSDYDMMVESVGDYINCGEQFVAYYMTFSGHYQYTLDNAMSAKNWDEVKDLPYSDAVKAYIACNLELEKAMAYLMEQLEDAGVADSTMIVLATDHYPYGLTDDEYAELSGKEISDVFDKQKSAFICYVPDMEPIHVDSYCCTVDILPTVLNLLGVDYDSRLLAGQDILSPDSRHMAIIADGSFITEGIRFDASKVAFEFENESEELSKLASELYELAEQKLQISTAILYSDYYAFAYDTQSESTGVEDPTAQYIDIDESAIMMQAPVSYVLKHGLIDPASDTKFGLDDSFGTDEFLLALYRAAGEPAVGDYGTDIPYTYRDSCSDAVVWAYQNGIILDGGVLMTDLSESMNVSQVAILIYRAAQHVGLDTTVNEETYAELRELYQSKPEEEIRASIYCRDSNYIGVGMAEMYIFHASSASVNKSFVTETLYRFCSYNGLIKE